MKLINKVRALRPLVKARAMSALETLALKLIYFIDGKESQQSSVPVAAKPIKEQVELAPYIEVTVTELAGAYVYRAVYIPHMVQYTEPADLPDFWVMKDHDDSTLWQALYLQFANADINTSKEEVMSVIQTEVSAYLCLLKLHKLQDIWTKTSEHLPTA